MYKYKRKISILLVIVVLLTTNLGIQLLPQSLRDGAENYLSLSANAATGGFKMAVAAGLHNSMAIKSDGTVFCWGSNQSGELGDGSAKNEKYTPIEAKYINNVVAVSSVDDCSYAVKSDGTVWKWGKIEQYLPEGTPVKVNGLEDIVDLKTGNDGYGDFYLALKSDGTVWSWGKNTYGQLGSGNKVSNYTPIQVPNLNNVIAIAAGKAHSVALKSDGTVWCWGENSDGQLGNGTTNYSSIPVMVPDLKGVTAIAAGSYFTIALKDDRTVLGWGNSFAFGNSSDVKSPILINGFSDVVKVAAGDGHCSVVKADGTVWGIGKSNYGQCGIVTTSAIAIPVQVNGISDVIDISARDTYNLAIKRDGSVYAWGRNTTGRLGDGTNTDRSSPVEAKGLKLLASPQSGDVEKVVLNKTSLTKSVGQMEQLTATVSPSAVADTSISWSIYSETESNTVSLSDNGLVTALKPGTAVVRASSSANTSKYEDCTVTVAEPVAATALTLNKESITIEKGLSEQLIASIQPIEATNQSVIWSVPTGSSFVSVANGMITALNVGTAVVRATINTADGEIQKDCSVTVKAIVDDYTDSEFSYSPEKINDSNNYNLSIKGKINNNLDVDYFKFAVSKKGTYRITSLYDPTGSLLNTKLLLESSGTNESYTQRKSVTSGYSVIQADLDIDKYYYVTMNMANWDEASKYILNIAYIEIPVNRIYFPNDTATLNIGDKKQLIPTVLPTNAANKNVNWSITSGAGIVSVSAIGEVEALKPGKAIVRATSVSNSGIYADCTITVDDYGNTTASAFTMSEDSSIHGFIESANDVDYFKFTAADTGKYRVSVVTDPAIIELTPLLTLYNSAGTQIEYNPYGSLQKDLVSGQTYYVKMEMLYPQQLGGYTLSIDSLTVHVTGITLPEDTTVIEPGFTRNLTAYILPSNATNKRVTWSVNSGDNIVTVSSIGLAQALKTGTTTVRAISVENTNIYKDCTVVVKDYGNSINLADSIIADTNIAGKIDTSSDSDYFKFTPSKTGVYTISTTRDSTALTPYLDLYDSSGKQISYSRDNYLGKTQIGAKLVEGQTYYIKMFSGYSSTGSYTLNVAYTVVPVKNIIITQEKVVLEQGKTKQLIAVIEPSLVSNDLITWSVPTGSGIVTVSSLGLVEALKPGKAIVRATSNDNTNIYMDCTVSVTTVGDYGEDLASAYPISDTASIQGLIDPAGEFDYFKFTATKSCTYKISATNDSGKAFNYKLYDNTGFGISASYSSNGYIFADLSAGETYYLQLGMANSSDIGNYTLNVEPYTTVRLSNIDIKIKPGEVKKLSATVVPSDLSQEVTWSTSDSAIASVADDGTVKGLNEGTVVVRATSVADSRGYGICTVTVDRSDTISGADISDSIGDSASVQGLFHVNNDVDYFKFCPSKTGEYKITADSVSCGRINGLALLGADGIKIADPIMDGDDALIQKELVAGQTYYIRIYSEIWGNYQLNIDSITVPVAELTISPTSIILEVGQTSQIGSTILPSNASNKEIQWSISSGSGIVSISAIGQVEGLKPGVAKVRATSSANSNKYAECTVTVTASGDQGDDMLSAYPISDSTSKSGAINPAGDCDYFKFIATATGYYTINTSTVGATSDTYLYLYDANGKLITSDDNSAGNGLSSIKEKLNADQTYYVKVTMSDESATGEYILNIVPPVVAVTDITLSQSFVQLKKDGKTQLGATVSPPNATNQGVIWTVISGNDIVTISSTGEVVAKKQGTAVVRATSVAESTVYKDCIVDVDYENSLQSSDNISLNTSIHGMLTPAGDYDYYAFTTPKGKSGIYKITTSLDPVGPDNKLYLALYGKSGSQMSTAESNNGYATISYTLVDETTYYIKVSDNSKNSKYILNVTAPDAARVDLAFSQNTVSLEEGEKKQLEVTVTPSDAANTQILWSVTSGSGIVSVSSTGVVEALTPGKAVVRASSASDISIFKECTITVTPKLPGSIIIGGKKYTAYPISDNTTSIKGTIETAGESDYYILSAPDYGTYAISTSSDPAGTTLDTYLYLLGPQTGRSFAEDDDSAGNKSSLIKYNFIKGQIFIIQVCLFDKSATGNYILNILPDDSVRVQSMTVSPKTAELRVGETKTIDVNIYPTNATNKKVIWSVTSGSGIVSVSAGEITALKSGTAVVRATSDDNSGIYVESTITVLNDDYGNTTSSAITIDDNANILGSIETIGDCDYFSFIPSKTGVYKISTSRDPSGPDKDTYLDLYDSNGSAIAYNNDYYNNAPYSCIETKLTESRKYYIKVSMNNNSTIGNYILKITAPPTVAVTDISLSQYTAEITVGSKCQLNATVSPPEATSQEIKWTVTSGSGIVSVSSGEVTALKPGVAVVRATSVANEAIYKECTINVISDPEGNTPKDASIENSQVRYNNADIPVKVTFNGHNLNSIMNGDKQLVKDQDYIISDVVFAKDGITTASVIITIKNSYLSTLPKDAVTSLTFVFDGGANPQLSVSIPSIDECFIATAAFGSKFQPAVAMLRQFRDKCLLTNWLGSQFVKFYYKNSPPVANFIAGNDILRGIIRGLLVPFIVVAYGILHPVVGCLELLAIIFAIVVCRKRRRKLIKV